MEGPAPPPAPPGPGLPAGSLPGPQPRDQGQQPLRAGLGLSCRFISCQPFL